MIEQLETLSKELDAEIGMLNTEKALEEFRLKHLVKKGTLQQFVEQLREVPKADKPQVGKLLNSVRAKAEQAWTQAKELLEQQAQSSPSIDVTLPARKMRRGTVHPINATLERALGVFKTLGFAVAEGPDIEDDAHCFSMLNFADDHPARDMQDTFFVASEHSSDIVLRTHTSSVQVRLMTNQKPPIRAVMPGRVYRNEAVSARSLAEFHQVEGLYIDKNVTFAQLKGTLVEFARAMYGKDLKYRFRPSYFPFTEPSAEMDITCYLCKGAGCRVCKFTGWLEILGCGMVHPNVLRNCGIDPEEYSGYAFGFGIERVTLLTTGIDDIRLLYENDVRVLRQF
ncbi:MAG TPA: phenylalanine--tRNA ligase subunit alpha [Candidatus Kapabacteria bacterium]|jgi:phenylalanyl-tRNA synthetase alpha chain|nr:phenylalanine--tRNA ligase subunit alpha [Ignavibacteria bacterium]HRI29944.1 phenylalanine--tRNA ligase subunit alpha [Candidatus Kapabacteria bacterium]HRK58044.1 phenylalanine--tRNA ligase subunit alpha [Candidatus Kapabacteria bacterium]